MWVLLVERIDPKRNGGLSTELINSGCNNKGVLNRAISWLRCVYKQPFLAPQPDPPASDLPILLILPCQAVVPTTAGVSGRRLVNPV
jgi:hypothetical protein